MNPWEEILQLLTEETEEAPPKPTLPEPLLPLSAVPEKAVSSKNTAEESAEKADKPRTEDAQNVIRTPAEKSQRVGNEVISTENSGGDGESVSLGKEQAGRVSPSHLQMEQTTMEIHSLGKKESPAQVSGGLTEKQVLALLDRYLTEEFLGTGGELLGND
jgi:hypothetical protein